MIQLMDYITATWPVWVCTGVGALGVGGGSIIRLLHKRVRALDSGMQAMLRDRIIQAYNYYKDKGYCPIYAKESTKRMYDAYHDLGGNDVATGLKDELLAMPTEKEE